MWFVKLIFQFSLGFTCTSDEDCNGHKCENGACHCGENWKIKPDCSGEWTCGKKSNWGHGHGLDMILGTPIFWGWNEL